MKTITYTVMQIIAIIALVGAGASHAAVVRLNPPLNENYAYCAELLKLALQHAGGDYRIEHIERTANVSQAREIEEVIAQQVDVIWLGTSDDLEKQLLPVRIPLYRGLLGHRLLLIRKGEQARFDEVNNLEDLKQFKLGQGRFWTDTNILEANGLPVIKAVKTDGLFYMLDGSRFDAFPRGAHEIWGELAEHAALDITVEQNLVIAYRLPMYFFVNPKNPQLAQDIEKGLLRMIEAGAFDAYFYASPMIQRTLNQAKFADRTIIELTNPMLPPETPLTDETLWFQIRTGVRPTLGD